MADVTRPATWDDVKTLAGLLDGEGTRWALEALKGTRRDPK
jgi:hypothetical protein